MDAKASGAQKRLAEWLTVLIHGESGLAKAQRASEILFGGEIGQLSDRELLEIFADVPNQEAAKESLHGEGLWIVDALRVAGLCASGGEARRAIQEASVYVNNVRIDSVDRRLTAADLASETVMVMRRGKKKYVLLKFIG